MAPSYVLASTQVLGYPFPALLNTILPTVILMAPSYVLAGGYSLMCYIVMMSIDIGFPPGDQSPIMSEIGGDLLSTTHFNDRGMISRSKALVDRHWDQCQNFDLQ